MYLAIPRDCRFSSYLDALRFEEIQKSGGDLLSRAVSRQVPSALEGLTTVFGMGTGVTPPPLPPENLFSCRPGPGFPGRGMHVPFDNRIMNEDLWIKTRKVKPSTY